MKIAWSNVIVGVVLLALGYSFREPGETVVLTRVDTIPYAAFRDSLKAERLTSDGLRDKLAGHVRVEPYAIIRTDTFVTPPDTVLQQVRVYANGVAGLSPLIRRDSLWSPEIHRLDVSACDDGWSWNAGEVVCDRARLGHLSPFVEAGATYPIGGGSYPGWVASAGIAWTPSYRSGWRASMETDPRGRLSLSLTRSWRVF